MLVTKATYISNGDQLTNSNQEKSTLAVPLKQNKMLKFQISYPYCNIKASQREAFKVFTAN